MDRDEWSGVAWRSRFPLRSLAHFSHELSLSFSSLFVLTLDCLLQPPLSLLYRQFRFL
jgi:hypothetical protein